MAEPLDVASTIGTWVAAFLAVVALFGILGPWLIWRTLRSERHVAIEAIDDETHEFVKGGITIWRGTTIFRRVVVPDLTRPPNSTDVKLPNPGDYVRRDSVLPKTPSRTGWITMIKALEAYSIPLPGRGELIYRDRDTWIPLHKLWLLAFGLLGRYSVRRDQGQTIQTSNPSRLDYQQVLKSKDQHLHDRDLHLDDQGLHMLLHLQAQDLHIPLQSPAENLHGSIGVLTRSKGIGNIDNIYLNPYSSQLRGDLDRDEMPLPNLFWLSVGCLPLTPSCVYDLSYDPASARELKTQLTPLRGFEGKIAEPSSSGYPGRRGRRNENNPITSQTPIERDYESRLRQSCWLRFKPISNIVPSSRWSQWAEAMSCDFSSLRILELDNSYDYVDADRRVAIEAIQTETRTDRFTVTKWAHIRSLHSDLIRNRDLAIVEAGPNDFILRTDLHRLCLSVLFIPATHRHYLFNKERAAFGFGLVTIAWAKRTQLFNSAEQMFPHWETVKELASFDSLRSLVHEISAISNIDPFGDFGRFFSENLSQLDNCITGLLPPFPEIVKRSIGVLYLSSPLFRTFIDDVAAYDPAYRNSTVEIDIKKNSIRTSRVPTASEKGDKTAYRLMFEEVFPQHRFSDAVEPIKVSSQALTLSCLQAWTRCTWFGRPLKSKPLLDFVNCLDEIVHVSAKTQPPLTAPFQEYTTFMTRAEERASNRLELLGNHQFDPRSRSRSPSLIRDYHPTPIPLPSAPSWIADVSPGRYASSPSPSPSPSPSKSQSQAPVQSAAAPLSGPPSPVSSELTEAKTRFHSSPSNKTVMRAETVTE
ncbi:hypothetical protein BDV95DRAFT_557755 [Massariosphaeria phaeospora]|uniref:Uncharacterized protein n=1 Tax=Massariosphaeria phaeospora TaxID=100035 RepID=A0A7C8INK1_9PLEO|nr:hypothetical protein BDV95DRAFT_557755 [Massariosphaeria phaeospora]